MSLGAQMMAVLQGSLNDVPGVRETFRAFRLHPVSTTYTLASTGQQPARPELLISNFDLGV